MSFISSVAGVITPEVPTRSQSIDSQQKLLKKLLKRAEKSRLGKQHQFADIENYQQFVKEIGLRPLEITHYKNQILDGEKDILTKGRPDYIVRTTGTVNSKKLPLTTELIKMMQTAGRDLVLQYAKVSGNEKVLGARL
jgi:hypothetical protein